MPVYLTMLLTAMLAPASDTTFAVRKGQRLEISAFAGSITVRTWNRDEVRVTGETARRDELEVDARATVVRVETTGHWGPASEADIVVTMPAWMPVSASGVETDITVQGCRCPIKAETVSGDVTVQGGDGQVDLQSVEGSVTASDISGRLNAETVNEDVILARIHGDVSAQTVNGDVTMDDVRSSSVRASTVNGDIRYVGTIQDQGSYELATHQGDLVVTIPETANASVTINTFNGTFESEYPVTITGRTQRRNSFTLGNGSARVALESFGGDIRMVRPGGGKGGK
jgi:hypothetical protein